MTLEGKIKEWLESLEEVEKNIETTGFILFVRTTKGIGIIMRDTTLPNLLLAREHLNAHIAKHTKHLV